MQTILKLSVIATALTFASCGGDAKHDEAVKAPNTGIDTKNIDSTAKPVDDFYQFVNGNWMKNNPIPESESRWGSFNELNEKNLAKLRAILDDAAGDKSAAAGSNKQKIGDFYSVANDSVKLNADGITPLKDELTAIDNIKTQEDLIKAVAHLHEIGVNTMFGGYIGQDPKISTEIITQLGQGGIALPDRDYYKYG